jgi:DNA-binding response OmpR family regulator
MQAVSAPSVLLIEPHDDTRNMYAEYLAFAGFDVVALATGEHALSCAVKADIVITGIRVPGIDGLQIVRILRRDERTSQKVLIVLTACAYEADRQGAYAAGCDEFLAKPCSPKALLSALRRVVALRSLRQRRPLRAGLQRPKKRRRTA